MNGRLKLLRHKQNKEFSFSNLSLNVEEDENQISDWSADSFWFHLVSTIAMTDRIDLNTSLLFFLSVHGDFSKHPEVIVLQLDDASSRTPLIQARPGFRAADSLRRWTRALRSVKRRIIPRPNPLLWVQEKPDDPPTECMERLDEPFWDCKRHDESNGKQCSVLFVGVVCCPRGVCRGEDGCQAFSLMVETGRCTLRYG